MTRRAPCGGVCRKAPHPLSAPLMMRGLQLYSWNWTSQMQTSEFSLPHTFVLFSESTSTCLLKFQLRVFYTKVFFFKIFTAHNKVHFLVHFTETFGAHAHWESQVDGSWKDGKAASALVYPRPPPEDTRYFSPRKHPQFKLNLVLEAWGLAKGRFTGVN